MEIALFGTSADPPTIAHQKIIAYLGSKYDITGVWAANNPFKIHGASLVQRQEMLELLLLDLYPQYPQIIADRNLSCQRTIDTLNYASDRWKNAQFTLVIGADLVNQISTWYRAKDLLSQTKLLIIPRHGYTTPDLNDPTLVNLHTEIAIAPLSVPGFSSTNIRQSQGDGLTPQVFSYIQQHQLYQLISSN